MNSNTGTKSYARALTIAGSDPSGGAGLQADLKTFSALGVFGTTAIVAVVDENTQGVYGVHPIPDDFVAGQIRSVLDDIGTDAIKIGMLHSAPLIRTVLAVGIGAVVGFAAVGILELIYRAVNKKQNE